MRAGRQERRIAASHRLGVPRVALPMRGMAGSIGATVLLAPDAAEGRARCKVGAAWPVADGTGVLSPSVMDANSGSKSSAGGAPVLDAAVYGALKNPRERNFLLKLENHIISNLKNDIIERIKLTTPIAPYLRFLVHLVADYFGLQRIVDKQGNKQKATMTLVRTDSTRVPERTLAFIVEEEQQKMAEHADALRSAAVLAPPPPANPTERAPPAPREAREEPPRTPSPAIFRVQQPSVACRGLVVPERALPQTAPRQAQPAMPLFQSQPFCFGGHAVQVAHSPLAPCIQNPDWFVQEEVSYHTIDTSFCGPRHRQDPQGIWQSAVEHQFRQANCFVPFPQVGLPCPADFEDRGLVQFDGAGMGFAQGIDGSGQRPVRILKKDQEQDTDNQDSAQLPPVGYGGSAALLEYAGSDTDETESSDESVPPAPVVVPGKFTIMKRAEGSDTRGGRRDDESSKTDPSRLPLQEREQAYRQARARIFGETVDVGSDPEDKSEEPHSQRRVALELKLAQDKMNDLKDPDYSRALSYSVPFGQMGCKPLPFAAPSDPRSACLDSSRTVAGLPGTLGRAAHRCGVPIR